MKWAILALLLISVWPCYAQDLTPPQQPEGVSDFMKRTENVAKQQAKEDEQTAGSWSQSLDRLPAGGWVFLEVSEDGQQAIFASRRQLIRDGKNVLAWYRWEYRHPQPWVGGTDYLSMVELTNIDCVRQVGKLISETLYAGNNLDNTAKVDSIVTDEKEKWWPVIPGTVGETLLNWACRNAPPRAKATGSP